MSRRRDVPKRKIIPDPKYRDKLVAILTGVALLGAGAVTLLLALVITPGFDQLEQAAVDMKPGSSVK